LDGTFVHHILDFRFLAGTIAHNLEARESPGPKTHQHPKPLIFQLVQVHAQAVTSYKSTHQMRAYIREGRGQVQKGLRVPLLELRSSFYYYAQAYTPHS
jgi:hypothetical protein